MIDW